MKISKRFIALFLCLIMAFSTFAVPSFALSEKNSESKTELSVNNIITDGYPMPNIGNIIQGFRAMNRLIYSITGCEAFSDDRFVVVADDMVQGFVDYIIEETGVDFSEIYTQLPAINKIPEMLTKTFFINTEEFQQSLKDLRKSLDAQGKTMEALLVYWFYVWMGIIDQCELCCVPLSGSDVEYQFAAKVTYRDGRTQTLYAPLYYNSETKVFHGSNGGPAFAGFDMNLEQVMTYTGVDVWMRDFGFCLAYDLFCYATPFLNYDTERIKFNYDNREWMIQVWKGRYIITNGGEVGIYNRAIGSKGTYYDCAGDDDMMVMSLDVYHGDKLLVHRDPTLHWWITGFGVSDTAYLPQTLTLISTITMKDDEMLKAFTAALDKMSKKMNYTVSGLDVTVTW